MAKEFKVVSARFAEHLIEELQTETYDDWEIIAYFQEMGVTKILLQKETKTPKETHLAKLEKKRK